MVLSAHPDVVWTDMADGVRLYHASSGEFRELNATAAEIWRLLANGHDEPAIVSELGTSYDATTEEDWQRLRNDIHAFFDALQIAGLVISVVDTSDPIPSTQR